MLTRYNKLYAVILYICKHNLCCSRAKYFKHLKTTCWRQRNRRNISTSSWWWLSQQHPIYWTASTLTLDSANAERLRVKLCQKNSAEKQFYNNILLNIYCRSVYVRLVGIL